MSKITIATGLNNSYKIGDLVTFSQNTALPSGIAEAVVVSKILKDSDTIIFREIRWHDKIKWWIKSKFYDFLEWYI